MYNVFKPIHGVVVAFVLGVLGTSAVVLATSNTGYESIDQQSLILTATFVRTSLDSNDGPIETPVPPAAPVQIAEAVPTATPPAAEEHVRSCAEIRSSETYLTEAERTFFLGSCEEEVTPAVVRAIPARNAVVLEAERGYRAKAESTGRPYLAGLRGYNADHLPETGAEMVQYGAWAGGWANQLNNFEPIPAAFLGAHQRLQLALWELDAHAHLIANGQESLSNEAYASEASRLAGALNGAISEYFRVVGLTLP